MEKHSHPIPPTVGHAGPDSGHAGPVRRAPHRGVYILPNLITLGSLLAGFIGITAAIRGDFEAAALAVVVSFVLDGLDGKIARLTRTTSDFGVQFDSLCDLVAFGVTPAILAWQWLFIDYGRLGVMTAFLFVACGALRLARFNVQTKTTSKKFFTGLPIPAAGGVIATLVFFADYLPQVVVDDWLPPFAMVLCYAVSFLMVSNVRYPSFKEYSGFREHPFRDMVAVLLLFALVFSAPRFFGFVLAITYVGSGLLLTALLIARVTPSASSSDSDDAPAATLLGRLATRLRDSFKEIS